MASTAYAEEGTDSHDVGTEATECPPEITRFDPQKYVGSDGDWIYVYWSVEDRNGNLDEVETTVHGSVITTQVSGDSASGTDVHGPFNYPYSYGVYIDATDEAGNTTSDSTSV